MCLMAISPRFAALGLLPRLAHTSGSGAAARTLRPRSRRARWRGDNSRSRAAIARSVIAELRIGDRRRAAFLARALGECSDARSDGFQSSAIHGQARRVRRSFRVAEMVLTTGPSRNVVDWVSCDLWSNCDA